MSTPYITPTMGQGVENWTGLADDLKPGYLVVQKAVHRINEKLKQKGVKHKIVIGEARGNYCYKPY